MKGSGKVQHLPFKDGEASDPAEGERERAVRDLPCGEGGERQLQACPCCRRAGLPVVPRLAFGGERAAAQDGRRRALRVVPREHEGSG
jgi:hypothetical protein